MESLSALWYQAGLRFECTRCGRCCTGEPGYVWVDEKELAAIALLRGEPIEQTRDLATRLVKSRRTLREKANGDCVFFDREKGCTVYLVRPIQCRTWPFWDSNLASPQRWEKACQACPGAGQGELIPVEEILRRQARIRI